jgi:hypothetical protein
MGLNECAFLLMSCISLVKPLKKDLSHLDNQEIKRYNLAINEAALRYNISPYLLLAIFKVESNFGRNMVSQTNDHGPMQINTWWFRRLGISKKTVRSPEGAMVVAAKILDYAREDQGKNRRCWWSAYHSVTPEYRRIYEASILKALRDMGFRANCSSEFLNSYLSALEVTAQLRVDAGAILASHNPE